MLGNRCVCHEVSFALQTLLRKRAYDAFVIVARPDAAFAALADGRLHALRHGGASLAHCAGIDLKTVPAQLRYSSIVLTADTCTSVLTDHLAYAAEATARLVLAAAARNPGFRHRPK